MAIGTGPDMPVESETAAEQDARETAELLESETSSKEYLEFLGDPDNPQGVNFLTSHTIIRSDPMWKRLGVKSTKDLTWERDPFGPKIGFEGNRFLMPIEDLSPEVATALEKVPGFKRVTVE